MKDMRIEGVLVKSHKEMSALQGRTGLFERRFMQF